MAGTDGKLCPRRRIVDCAKLSTLCMYQITPLSKDCKNDCRVCFFKVNYLIPRFAVNVFRSFGVRTTPRQRLFEATKK